MIMDEQQIALSQRTVPLPHLGSPLLSRALIAQNQALPGWFAGDSSTNGLDLAKKAFEDAVQEFSTEVSAEECAKWLSGSNTIFDVEQAVISAKQKYEKKSPKSRARKWLSSCSSRLMYYSVIMDTLSQHHPEYVSLAWGAIKFLFIAVLNHEELLTEIAKTVSKIANILPRADLCSHLYPTQRMRVAVAQLYAKVMYFVQDAVKWYKKGKLAHSVSAVFKPYSLGFKAIVEEISEASRRVDQEASAASKAEIRELHIKIEQLAQMSMAHFSRQSLATTNVTDQLAHQTRMLRQQEMLQITSIPILSRLPNAEESLQYCRSIKIRRRTQWLIDPSQISKLREWHEDPHAYPILVAHCRGLHNVARDFSVELLDMIRESGVSAIWGLSYNTSDESVSLMGLLLSLVMQGLVLNPKVLNDGTISNYHFQQASTEDQCFKLLGGCLSGLSKLYIILDMAVVNAAVKYDERLASVFVQKFVNLLLARPERGVKLVIVAGELEGIFDTEQYDLDESQIFVVGQSPGGPSKRRRTGRGLTRYSSHVFPFRGGTTRMISRLSRDADTSESN